MTTQYEQHLKHLYESLGISPFVSRSQPVDAIPGTNQGMTNVDLQNTFPSTLKTVKINLPKKRNKTKQQKKD